MPASLHCCSRAKRGVAAVVLCVNKKTSAQLTWAFLWLLCDLPVAPAAFHAQILSLTALPFTQLQSYQQLAYLRAWAVAQPSRQQHGEFAAEAAAAPLRHLESHSR
jgi:hypothetical protein